MTGNAWIQFVLFLGVLVATVKPLGWYMSQVYQGKPCWLDRWLGPVEHWFYQLAGVDPLHEMSWRAYALAVLLFNGAGLVFLYVLLRLQDILPLNPQEFSAVGPDLAFNTAASFVSNTNWQSYAGETTLSYLSQMLGLACRISCPPPRAWPSSWPSFAAWSAGRCRRSATSGWIWCDQRCTSCCPCRWCSL